MAVANEVKQEKAANMNEALLNLLSSSSSGSNQFVTFKLAGEEYGLDIKSVQEITAYRTPTHIPNVHSSIKGVFNLRGNVIPILDPRIKFGLDSKEHDSFSVVIIFKAGTRTVGMIVDEVSDVLNIENEEIQETPEFSSNINTKFIKGIGKVGDKLVILLDLDKMFSDEEFMSVA